MRALARALRARLRESLDSGDEATSLLEAHWSDVAVMVDRARQRAALGGAVLRAVRGAWGAGAAESLRDVPGKCALEGLCLQGAF